MTVALVSFSFPFIKIMGKRKKKATHKNAASYVCGVGLGQGGNTSTAAAAELELIQEQFLGIEALGAERGPAAEGPRPYGSGANQDYKRRD